MMKKIALTLLLIGSIAGSVFAANCRDLPSNSQLKAAMLASASPTAGGLFGGARMWGAVVNRDGEICGFVTTTGDPTQVWPGSQAIQFGHACIINGQPLHVYATGAFPLESRPIQSLESCVHCSYGRTGRRRPADRRWFDLFRWRRGAIQGWQDRWRLRHQWRHFMHRS